LLLKQFEFWHVTIPRLALAESFLSFTFIDGRWLLDRMRACLGRHKIYPEHVGQQRACKNHHILEIPFSFLAL